MKAKKPQRKKTKGIVVSHNMKKTAVVRLERHAKHSLYGKTLIKRTKAYAHDETDSSKVGDKVILIETRPLSKLKRWRVVKILNEGE
jgi:small subunit ribosomal protein S17